jgi:hypothetical protein
MLYIFQPQAVPHGIRCMQVDIAKRWDKGDNADGVIKFFAALRERLSANFHSLLEVFY